MPAGGAADSTRSSWQYHSLGSTPARCSLPMAALVAAASGKAVWPPLSGLWRSAGVWAAIESKQQ